MSEDFSHSVSVSMPADFRVRMDAEARKRGVSRSSFIKYALEKLLDEPDTQEANHALPQAPR